MHAKLFQLRSISCNRHREMPVTQCTAGVESSNIWHLDLASNVVHRMAAPAHQCARRCVLGKSTCMVHVELHVSVQVSKASESFPLPVHDDLLDNMRFCKIRIKILMVLVSFSPKKPTLIVTNAPLSLRRIRRLRILRPDPGQISGRLKKTTLPKKNQLVLTTPG